MTDAEIAPSSGSRTSVRSAGPGCAAQQQPDRAGLEQQLPSGRLAEQAEALPTIDSVIAIAATAIARLRG